MPAADAEPMPATDAEQVPQPGVDVPDRRGRTGLDRVGRDLDRNPRVRVRDVRLLTSNWYVTRTTTFDFQHADGTLDAPRSARPTTAATARRSCSTTSPRARCCSPGSSASRRTSTSTPTACSSRPSAACSTRTTAEIAIRREAEEETGHTVGDVEHVFDVYMSPGSVTERAALLRGALRARHRRARLARAAWPTRARTSRCSSSTSTTRSIASAHDIVDAKTIMLLQWAALRGPFSTTPSTGVKRGILAPFERVGYPRTGPRVLSRAGVGSCYVLSFPQFKCGSDSARR